MVHHALQMRLIYREPLTRARTMNAFKKRLLDEVALSSIFCQFSEAENLLQVTKSQIKLDILR
jgi:hypothetical protein